MSVFRWTPSSTFPGMLLSNPLFTVGTLTPWQPRTRATAAGDYDAISDEFVTFKLADKSV